MFFNTANDEVLHDSHLPRGEAAYKYQVACVTAGLRLRRSDSVLTPQGPPFRPGPETSMKAPGAVDQLRRNPGPGETDPEARNPILCAICILGVASEPQLS